MRKHEIHRIVSCLDYYHVNESYTEEDYLNAADIMKAYDTNGVKSQRYVSRLISFDEFDYQMYLSLLRRKQIKKDEEKNLKAKRRASMLFISSKEGIKSDG